MLNSKSNQPVSQSDVQFQIISLPLQVGFLSELQSSLHLHLTINKSHLLPSKWINIPFTNLANVPSALSILFSVCKMPIVSVMDVPEKSK